MHLDQRRMWKNIFITLLFIGLYGTFLYQTASHTFSFSQHDIYMLFGFLGMYVILSLFPITLKKTTITLDGALAISIFLIYGFYVEAWMSQFSLLLIMFFHRVRNYRRYLVNMMMFLLISYFSALVYDWVRPEGGFYLAVLAYIFIYFASNELLVIIARWLIYDEWSKPLFTEVAWNLLVTLIISPLGLLLYLFYQGYGHESLLFFSVPILVLSLLTRFYYEMQEMNRRLQEMNQLIYIFSSKLHLQEVVEAIYKAIYTFYLVDGIILYLFEENKLKVIGNSGELPDGAKKAAAGEAEWTEGESLAHETLRERRMLRSSDEEGNGILSLPLIRNGEALGVLILSFQKSVTLSPLDRYLWQVLANQAGNAIYNAIQYEKTYMKVYFDELTGIENFRSFDAAVYRLAEEADREGSPISLLIFDLDHFKEINDRYGHLAGDEVLKKIAEKLRVYFEEKGKVYRYGGEEFTVLLPGVGEEEAFRMAEEVRQQIADLSLEVTDTIHQEGEKVLIQVTVSIGISTYPTQAANPLELVRNADRAMYLGAKQAGRNRCSLYVG